MIINTKWYYKYNNYNIIVECDNTKTVVIVNNRFCAEHTEYDKNIEFELTLETKEILKVVVNTRFFGTCDVSVNGTPLICESTKF